MKLVAGMVAAILAVNGSSALAAVYKCTDASGKISFQQQACPQDATGSKLSVGNAEWVVLTRDDNQHYTREKSVDIGNVKSVGKYVRAPMKETTLLKGKRAGSSDVQRSFVYYDCVERTVSQQIADQRAPEYERKIREGVSDPTEWRMRDPNNVGLQKACASAAPAPAPVAEQ